MNSIHACRTIIKAGHTGDLAVVLDALDHDEPEVRVAAMGAAHRLQALTIGHLAEALSDISDLVRYRAVELAARSDHGAEIGHRLIDALSDPALSEVAAFALGELELDAETKRNAVAALGLQATTHDDALSRESAVAALGALEDGLSFVLTATGDVATVRRRAVLALAPFEGPEVDAALEAALDDRDWQVRQAAEDLLD